MPDRTLAGSVPGADAASYPPGTIWMQLVERAADATGKTIGVNLWSSQMARYVGYQLGGPGYDMPGGPYIAVVNPSAWTTPPAVVGQNPPGKITVADFVIAKVGFYRFEAEVSGVRTHLSAQVGKPDQPGQMGPDWDSEAILDNTYMGRLARERQNIRDMQRPSPIIGSGKKMGKIPKVPPR